MPQIPTYEDHVQPQGQLGVQANGNDFGAQIGDGMQNLGMATESAGEQVQKVQNDQGRMWAYTAASKAYTGLQQDFTAKANALDPADPQFNTKFAALQPAFQQSINDTTNQLQSQAPNRMAARVLASHMASNGSHLMHSAMETQAQVFATKTQYETQQGMAADQNSLASDPSNGNYDTLVQNRVDSIGGLESIGPEQKLKFQQMVKHGMAVTQVDVLSSTDPHGFLAAVNAGGGRTTQQGFTHGAVPGVAAPTDGSAPAVAAPAADGSTPNTAPADGTNASVNPADQAQRLTDNMAAIRAELAKPDTTPANRAILQTELDKNLAESVTTPPTAAMPQVQPLSDSDIAGATPPIHGWGELTWPERVAAVRKAEANVGGGLAADRGTMDRDLRDAQVSLMAGKSFDGLDGPKFSLSNMQRLYGPDEGQRRFDGLGYVKQVGGFISQMSAMPTAQAASMLQHLEPQGGQGMSEQQPLYHQAVEAFQRLGKMRDDDYMQWAQNNGVGNVQPLDMTSPVNFSASIRARVPAAIAGRTDYQADAHLLSKADVDSIGTMLDTSSPSTQMAYIKGMKNGLAGNDDWFSDTIHQLAPKNTTIQTAAAVSTHSGTVQTDAGPQDGNTVGQYILEGAHILQGKDLDEKTSNGRAFRMDDGKFSDAFWMAVGPSAFQSPDSTLANSAASDTMQAVKNYYAADTLHRGLDPSNVNYAAVASAVRAVTGGVVDAQNGSRLFTPWGIPPDQFKDELPSRTQAAIDQAGVKAHAADQYKLINLEEGKYGLMFGKVMLAGKNGKPVVVDYSQPMPKRLDPDPWSIDPLSVAP